MTVVGTSDAVYLVLPLLVLVTNLVIASRKPRASSGTGNRSTRVYHS